MQLCAMVACANRSQSADRSSRPLSPPLAGVASKVTSSPEPVVRRPLRKYLEVPGIVVLARPPVRLPHIGHHDRGARGPVGPHDHEALRDSPSERACLSEHDARGRIAVEHLRPDELVIRGCVGTC